MVGIAILSFGLIIGIYIVAGVFLNKFNRLVFGEGTPMAWIPVANIYLLGKLTFGKPLGWGLLLIVFLTGNYKITINGVEKSFTILPENTILVVNKVFVVLLIALFIYAIVRYRKLKIAVNNVGVGEPQQNKQFKTMQEQMAYQSLQFQKGTQIVNQQNIQRNGQMNKQNKMLK